MTEQPTFPSYAEAPAPAEAVDDRDITQALRDVDAQNPAPPSQGIATDVPRPTWTLQRSDSAPAYAPPRHAAPSDAAPSEAPGGSMPPADEGAVTALIPVVSPAAPPPVSPTHSPAPPVERESVTCPECGTPGTIVVSRRDAADFCATCDFPLFWTPSRVLLDRASLSDESLRRLPGTVGRVAIASFPCPHCSEPNAVSAIDCIRCGRPLHPVRMRMPEPVYVAPPPPVYEEPEPEPSTPWWVWLLFYLALAGGVVLVILYATGTIG
jgi:hypothetical protein